MLKNPGRFGYHFLSGLRDAVMYLHILFLYPKLIRKAVILLYSRVIRQDMQCMNSLNPKGDHLPEIL